MQTITKIIFLDIDGVVIPQRSYFKSTHPRADDNICHLLNYLMKHCEPCKIVICSTRSIRLTLDEFIDEIFKSTCINKSHFHTDWVVDYPGYYKRINTIDNTEYYISNRRDEAVFNWLIAHPEVTHHVVFDDAKHRDDNWIPINNDYGISTNDFRIASAMLGNYDSFLVLL